MQKVVRPKSSTPRHSVDNGRTTPVPIEPGGPVSESTPNQSFSNSTPRRQRRSSTSSNVSVPGEERSDVESDVDASMRSEHLTINELREMYRKQDKTLKRYKRKFAEVKK